MHVPQSVEGVPESLFDSVGSSQVSLSSSTGEIADILGCGVPLRKRLFWLIQDRTHHNRGDTARAKARRCEPS